MTAEPLPPRAFFVEGPAPFLAVGFGTAAQLAQRRLAEEGAHLQIVARSFVGALTAHDVDFDWVGEPEQRLPGHVSLRWHRGRRVFVYRFDTFVD